MVGVTTAAIIILLSGGGGVEHYLTDLKKEVNKTIEDKDRKKVILNESKALSKELKTLGKEINSHFKDVIQVHADFHATEAAYDAVLKQLVADQNKATALILDARDSMHEQMTKEEWQAVFRQKD